MIILLILYTSFYLPLVYGIKNIEEYNPKLIPVGAVAGVIAIVSLLIAIWPVWGFTSFLIFIALWKGFFSISLFLPSGQLGNILFILINTGIVLSFYVIEHEGYFHWLIQNHNRPRHNSSLIHIILVHQSIHITKINSHQSHNLKSKETIVVSL